MPEWLMFVVSLVGAAVTAFFTARSTLRGSREQALATEQMKLRHDITRRRMEEFDVAAERLSAVAKRLAFDEDARKSFWDDYPGMQLSVLLGAERVMLPEHWRAIGAVSDSIGSSCGALFDTLSGVGGYGLADITEDDLQPLTEHSSALVADLHVLVQWVDVSIRAQLTGA
jgi:hypothetical protein